MDTVFVKDLKIDTVIGIFDWERTIKQTVVIDVALATDISFAAAAEDIDKTISYKDVTDKITAFIEDSEFLLVETMAEAIASLLLKDFTTPWVRVKVGKPGAIAAADSVGVIIERGSKPQ